MPRGVYQKTLEHREKLRQLAQNRSPETREKLRQAAMGNKRALGCKRSPEYCQKLAQRPFLKTSEYRIKMSRALKGRKLRPADYRPSIETREKMRAAALKQPPRSAATCEKLRQARLRMWQSPDSREKLLASRQTPEYREARRQARLRQRFPKKMTSLERILRHEFKKRRLKFEMHKMMFGRFQPDFVFESVNLIVEADGDYWHRQLKRDHVPLFQAATENGWTVWRFAESEIFQHPEACGRAVARFVRSH